MKLELTTDEQVALISLLVYARHYCEDTIELYKKNDCLKQHVAKYEEFIEVAKQLGERL